MGTDKQIEILNIIKKYVEENKMAPTVREICGISGLKSTSTVYGYLKRLEKQGYIKKKDNSPRSITIINKEENKMPIYNEINVKCRWCGNEHKYRHCGSINITRYKEKKYTILNNSFFQFRCSECGKISQVTYKFLYYDTEKKIMICMIPDYSESLRGELEHFIKDNISEDILKENYIMRVVSNINQLTEKILINDNDLDDRIIELLKVYYMSMFRRSNENEEIEELGLNLNGDTKYITFFLKDGRGQSFKIDKRLCEEFEKKYIKMLDENEQKRFEEINVKWAESIFYK